ncbi:MAG: DUF445 domain-containing protein [Granulosicoccus sp.]|nr:DUF445 domain-containing protein [Granulosicoccus sp.]
MLTKNIVPNLVALGLILVSLLLAEPWRTVILSTGLFALSGALTNWLAVHMLFERIPGLYGSGVITLHFEEFKAAILKMVHDELLDKDNIERLLKQQTQKAEQNNESHTENNNEATNEATIDIETLLSGIDLDAAYDQLVATIVESSFGSMLAMVGGEAALQPLREPFKKRMQQFLSDAARSPRVKSLVNEQISKFAGSDRFTQKLEQLLKSRLDEMTPEMVKEIMQRMIRNHLGWLVVWGGVFGGLIGCLAGLISVF